ncbi:UxaA family hydrolase [Paenibacillus sp. 7124]|uniref:UxaA family hydrolase n=1 Tax=Paenibacillus apii TaxID=1850370 RepID=A0A6M1PMI6_9BACL|nr:UxaA family hydrolase [Paenibacillus apii]NGM83714.1 UxaA family hydrolase [Paenibacillus apii]NJJ41181.1 UxaA family hydrolase [Paenibacillus apii]
MGQLFGYRRENGKVGIRNHVIILPVDDISNAACEAVAKVVSGTLALPHAYGRLQFGEDLALHFRTMIGTGSNPNVAAVIVIGIEPNWTKIITDGIAATGKPVAGFSIEGLGDLEVIRRAAWKAKEFVQWATELQREPISLSELTVSIKCGESDTTTGLASCPTVGETVDYLIDQGATVFFGETSELTGGEHLIADRMATEELRGQFQRTYDRYVSGFASQGVDLLGSQPTQGNIAGGLSTIEEKALGNIEKTGTKQVIGVLKPAEAPQNGPGLYFMDSSSAAAECVTLMAAAGAVVHFFPTGQGNVIGNPIEPVIKISANPKTVKLMAEHIDVDVSPLLERAITLLDARERLLENLERTVNGRLTAAEALGHREFVMTKLYPSA